MKYLLVLVVILVGFWAWRSQRQAEIGQQPRRKATSGPKGPARMVACRHCGTHVPDGEQVRGQLGDYCCADHRQQAEVSPGR